MGCSTNDQQFPNPKGAASFRLPAAISGVNQSKRG